MWRRRWMPAIADPGVTQLTAVARLGGTQVVLQFELSRNLDGAAQDVQTAVQAAAGQRLNGAFRPRPSIRRWSPPISRSWCSRSGPTPCLPTNTTTMLDSIACQRVSRIDGVGQVNIFSTCRTGHPRPDRSAQGWPCWASTWIRCARPMPTTPSTRPRAALVGDDRNLTIYADDQGDQAPTSGTT